MKIDLKTLARLAQQGDIYIRWDENLPRTIQRGYSLRAATTPEIGISVNSINPFTQIWTARETPLLKAAMALQEYSFVGGKCYIITGTIIGRGGDNEPLLDPATIRIIGTMEDANLDTALQLSRSYHNIVEKKATVQDESIVAKALSEEAEAATEAVSPVVEITPIERPVIADVADVAGVGKITLKELVPRGRAVLTSLDKLMAETGMSREQISRAVATGMGRFPSESWARKPEEADTMLAKLFTAMREQRRAFAPEVTNEEEAGELRRLIQKHAPVDSGELRDSFDDPRTVQILADGSIEVDSDCPYARIQDLGGTIHREGTNGPYTIRIPAQHYVEAAILEYNAIHQTQFNQNAGFNIMDMTTRGMAFLQQFREIENAFGGTR